MLKANLVGVTNLKPSDTGDFRWYMKMRCTNCGEMPDHWQYIFMNVPGGKGHAHLVEKCKLCGRVNTLTIVDDSFQSYSIDRNEQWQPLVKFDCRGVEPAQFDPRVEGAESGAVFEEVDLGEGEWVDYDEKAGATVEINSIESRFVHAKK